MVSTRAHQHPKTKTTSQTSADVVECAGQNCHSIYTVHYETISARLHTSNIAHANSFEYSHAQMRNNNRSPKRIDSFGSQNLKTADLTPTRTFDFTSMSRRSRGTPTMASGPNKYKCLPSTFKLYRLKYEVANTIEYFLPSDNITKTNAHKHKIHASTDLKHLVYDRHNLRDNLTLVKRSLTPVIHRQPAAKTSYEKQTSAYSIQTITRLNKLYTSKSTLVNTFEYFSAYTRNKSRTPSLEVLTHLMKQNQASTIAAKTHWHTATWVNRTSTDGMSAHTYKH